MPDLVLGAVLRHVGTTDATVWVETDRACEVRVSDAGGPVQVAPGITISSGGSMPPDI